MYYILCLQTKNIIHRKKNKKQKNNKKKNNKKQTNKQKKKKKKTKQKNTKVPCKMSENFTSDKCFQSF